MPVLSMFYGIVAYMYSYETQEHHLRHSYAEYVESSAVVAIANGEVLEESLPQNKDDACPGVAGKPS
ncbi:DUF4160 domain-containing protein [Accumulibacter sp.]|jgi:hypothetical protein|uniref:DUF4160 domain-containing protein n=1 Tax=Candidatus Accumulibacter TaxID=327159 RepID=UPI0025B7FBAF|nr:DUF4160 domain-containing protein [Accumulibacter sp.]